jgi:hypothetical protein
MEDIPRRNDDDYVREGGPYADVILKGIDSANRGDLIPAEEVFDRLEAKYRALAEKRGLLS